MLANITRFIESPYTALAAALALGALALSGKLNVNATYVLLVATWAIGIVGCRELATPLLIGVGLILAGVLVVLACWFQPDAVPGYAGVLKPKPDALLFSTREAGAIQMLEI